MDRNRFKIMKTNMVNLVRRLEVKIIDINEFSQCI